MRISCVFHAYFMVPVFHVQALIAGLVTGKGTARRQCKLDVLCGGYRLISLDAGHAALL
jgi:hypothetical protein